MLTEYFTRIKNCDFAKKNVDENFTWLIRKNVGHHILLKIFIYTIYKENTQFFNWFFFTSKYSLEQISLLFYQHVI